MRKKLMILAGVCMLCLCGGCGQGPAGAADEAGTALLDTGDGDELADGEGEQEDTEEPLPAAEKEEEAEPEEDRSLTEAELAEYTKWIQDISNYGFLLSDWDEPTQIDLYQVFYDGAGVAGKETEQEKQAYMERNDLPEIYTDFQSISKKAVNAFLLEKVGFSYDELVDQGGWGLEDWYYEETDSFCTERGDTNYCEFVCIEGEISEGGTIVTLNCEGDDWVKSCEVKLNVAAGNRIFLSNHIVDGLILDSDADYEADDEYYEEDDEYYEGDDEYYEGDDEYYEGDDEYYEGDDEYYEGDDEYYEGDDEYYEEDDEYYEEDDDY